MVTQLNQNIVELIKIKEQLPKVIKNNIIPSEDKVRGGGNTHLLLIVKDDKLPSS